MKLSTLTKSLVFIIIVGSLPMACQSPAFNDEVINQSIAEHLELSRLLEFPLQMEESRLRAEGFDKTKVDSITKPHQEIITIYHQLNNALSMFHSVNEKEKRNWERDFLDNIYSEAKPLAVRTGITMISYDSYVDLDPYLALYEILEFKIQCYFHIRTMLQKLNETVDPDFIWVKDGSDIKKYFFVKDSINPHLQVKYLGEPVIINSDTLKLESFQDKEGLSIENLP